jgi:hypothetical protein
MLEPFLVSGWPDGFLPVEGTVHEYDAREVNRRLSTTAVPLQESTGKLSGSQLEVYSDRERFWLVDERWGLAEINLLKGQWRSWIIPSPSIDPIAVAELAVVWPMAQLLRSKGLYLLPAASVSRGSFGMLIISPYGIQPELRALVRAGFKVTGQQWTALREEDGRIAMLHVPGHIERGDGRRFKSLTSLGVASSRWTDLAAEVPGVSRFHAFCDAVLLVEAGRRPEAWVREVANDNLQNTLRRHWPIDELHPLRRPSRMLTRLASKCRLFEARLSRHPEDLLRFVDGIRLGSVIKQPAPQRLSGGPVPYMTLSNSAAANPPENLTPWSMAG